LVFRARAAVSRAKGGGRQPGPAGRLGGRRGAGGMGGGRARPGAGPGGGPRFSEGGQELTRGKKQKKTKTFTSREGPGGGAGNEKAWCLGAWKKPDLGGGRGGSGLPGTKFDGFSRNRGRGLRPPTGRAPGGGPAAGGTGPPEGAPHRVPERSVPRPGGEVGQEIFGGFLGDGDLFFAPTQNHCGKVFGTREGGYFFSFLFFFKAAADGVGRPGAAAGFWGDRRGAPNRRPRPGRAGGNSRRDQ